MINSYKQNSNDKEAFKNNYFVENEFFKNYEDY